jgi:hypothetical protein
VIECAGSVLLRMPELVRSKLGSDTVGRSLAKALQQLGSAGAQFAPDLIALLDLSREDELARYGFHLPQELASIAQEDAATVLALESRLLETDRTRAEGAAETLRAMGPRAARFSPTLVDTLKKLATKAPDYHFHHCLASIGRDREDVFEMFLNDARPAPPRMKETSDGYRWNETMFVRGVALEALGNFTAFAERAMPVLIDALDNFQEYDPDWSRGGAQSRIIASLHELGPASSSAVPALAKRLHDKDGDIDWTIVNLLADLGPAASGALPALQELLADFDEGPIADAINKIRRER